MSEEQEDRRELLTDLVDRVYNSIGSSVAAYGGVHAVWKECNRRLLQMGSSTKAKLREIKEILAKIDSYGKFRQPRHPKSFARTPIYAPFVDALWMCDSAYMPKSPRGRPKFFLIIVDIFSRFVFTSALHSLKAAEVAVAFQSILDETGRKPVCLGSDKVQSLKK